MSSLPPIIRRSYRDSILMTLLFLLGFNLILGSLRVLYLEGLSPAFNQTTLSHFLGRWEESLIYSGVCGTLMALLLPWFIPLAYAEWFYTRPLNFREVFGLMWREYLRWWLILALGLVGLVYWIQRSGPAQEAIPLTWGAALALLGLNLFFAMFLAVDDKTRYQQVKPLYIIMLWGLLAAFGGKTWPLVQQISPKVFALLSILTLGWAAWHTYLSQKSVVQDVEPARNFGHNFLAFFSQGTVKLKNLSVWQQRWFQYRLLTRESHWLYSAIFAVIVLLLAIGLSSRREPLNFFTYEAYISSFLWALLLMLIPARVLWSRDAELYLTRAVSARQVYLMNWLHQGLIMLLVVLLGFASQVVFAGPVPLFQTLLLPLFFWLGGPLALLSMVSIMIVGWVPPWLTPGTLLTMLTTPSMPALSLWTVVLLFRGLELWQLRQGISEKGWRRLLGAIQPHVFPTCLILAAVFWALNQHPLLRALTQDMAKMERYNAAWVSMERIQLMQIYGAYQPKYMLLGLLADEVDELDEQSPWEFHYRGYRVEALQQALKEPYSSQTARLMAAEHYAPLVAYLELEIQTTRYFGELFKGFAADQRMAQNWLKDHPELQTDPELLTLSLFSQKQWQQSLEQAEQAYAQNPSAELGINQARLQAHFFKYDQAMKSYAQVAQHDPEHAARAYLLAGRVGEHAGDLVAAARYYLKSREHTGQADSLTPELMYARFALGRLPFYRHGACELAAEIAELPGIFGNSALHYHLQAQLQLCAGESLPERVKDMDATVWLRQRGRFAEALQYAPASAHGFRAQLHRKLGDQAEFERELKQGFRVSYSSFLYPKFKYENQQLLLRLSLFSQNFSAEDKQDAAQKLLLQSPQLIKSVQLQEIFSDEEWAVFSDKQKAQLRALSQDIHRLYQQLEQQGVQVDSLGYLHVYKLRAFQDYFEIRLENYPHLQRALKAKRFQDWAS
jgi:hypothetical protein